MKCSKSGFLLTFCFFNPHFSALSTCLRIIKINYQREIRGREKSLIKVNRESESEGDGRKKNERVLESVRSPITLSHNQPKLTRVELKYVMACLSCHVN